ncbi:hypothetical protein EDB86DRAFT_3244181 [Lactarius hatsudake]|nr:hypothetical protein EDB86DRAFT_3244181 [Lactarius hatsudake]
MTEKSPQRTVKSLIFHNSALHSGALIIHSEEWALASFLAKLSSSATGRNRNDVGHVTHPCASKRSVGQRTMLRSVVQNMVIHSRQMINDSAQIMTLAAHFITSCNYFAPSSPKAGERRERGKSGRRYARIPSSLPAFERGVVPQSREHWHQTATVCPRGVPVPVHRPVQGDNDAWATANGFFNADLPSKPGVGESRNMP